MSTYQALYRVWRPQRFREMVGQEQNVAALQHAVRDNRLSHAYLFCGPRGTGKTSLAKILARAVNCENPQDGEPCNECSSCRDIANGSFMDVIEIDAASNRGIDEIRDLREKVRIMPAQGKKKVYIIDEVHMLTNEAFNALLKTLEEPPAYIIFILATTEAHKIPATILSRCQKYNFRNFTSHEVVDHIRKVAAASDMAIDEDALLLIGRRANGGMRDALGMLDQIQSYKGGGQSISRADVLDVLGLVDDAFIADLIDAAIAQELGRMAELLAEAVRQGKEAALLLRESSLYLRDLLLFSAVGEAAGLTMVAEQNRGRLKAQAQKLRRGDVLKALQLLMDSGEKIRFNESQRFLMEYCFFELAHLLNPAAPAEAAASASAKERAMRPEPRERIADVAAIDPAPKEKLSKKDAREAVWQQLLALVKKKRLPTHALLSPAKLIGSKGDVIVIAYKQSYRLHRERMELEENLTPLRETLQEMFKKSMEVEFILLNEEENNNLLVKEAIEQFGEDVVNIKD